MKYVSTFLVAGCLFVIFTSTAAAEKVQGPFLAYSLREVCKRLEAGKKDNTAVELGGLTRIAGVVYDDTGKDVILVGLANEELPKAHLDDLVVALRARMASAPLLSSMTIITVPG